MRLDGSIRLRASVFVVDHLVQLVRVASIFLAAPFVDHDELGVRGAGASTVPVRPELLRDVMGDPRSGVPRDVTGDPRGELLGSSM